jgi:pilus assembly protein CpaB
MPRRITGKAAALPLGYRVGPNIILVSITVVAVLFAAVTLNTRNKSSDDLSPKVQDANQNELVEVTVPASIIPAGVKLKDVEFKRILLPSSQVTKDVVLNLEEKGDWVTKAILPASVPIYAENLSASGLVSNSVTEKIPPGMRAMSVRVDETTSVEGWVTSGTIVDVLMVNSERTAVIAESVKVLSAGKSATSSKGESSSTPNTVTLLVTQEQCLSINTAQKQGSIALVLRGNEDEASWSRQSLSAANLNGKGKGSRPINGTATIIDKKKGDSQTFVLIDRNWTAVETSKSIKEKTLKVKE